MARTTVAQLQQQFTAADQELTLARLKKSADILRKSKLVNLRPVLPLLFNLRGKPYTLEKHFPFEPQFNTRMPLNSVLKTGRQVSKSTSLASRGILFANCIPHFSQLYVTPLYEMIRRFSNNYVRSFIEQSPVKRLWSNTSTENSVLQRSFTNKSKMIFSFAFLDADRTRGISADELSVDEAQDIDPDHLPIMKETMSASPWGMTRLAGTPKTLEGTLEGAWQQSSKGEWVIPCRACHYENVPTLSHDLDDMIGPDRDDISPAAPGVVCAKCRRHGKITPIFPTDGRWVHEEPGLIYKYVGYHVPQFIMPMHYASRDKWQVLLGKRAGVGNTSINVFYNEVCGESYDLGAKLITSTDLKRAATLNENTLEEAIRVAHSEKYVSKILSVDWGGGGQERTSFTTVAAMGMLPNGEIEVFFGWRSLTPHDFLGEATQILELMAKLGTSHLVHDYNGSGEGRHLFIAQSGFPNNNIIPVAYVRAASKGIFRFIPENDTTGQRPHWQADKTRSLHLTAAMIKEGMLRFFRYDYKSPDDPGLLHDFLQLVEDKVDSRMGNDIYTIIRDTTTKRPDDFAQAVNMGSLALMQMNDAWPNIALRASLKASAAVLEAANPFNANLWDEISQYGPFGTGRESGGVY